MGIAVTMPLVDALARMREVDGNGNPVPFTLQWTTLDEARNTGGELREEKLVLPHSGLRSQDYQNMIRNLKGADGRVKAVHIHLMHKIDGKTIV